MHIKRNEAEILFLYQNKTRLLKEKENKKSSAQQGSTVKRNLENTFYSIQSTGFLFFFFPKKGTSYNLPRQTNRTKDRRQRQTCTCTQQKCSHNTHTQLSSLHAIEKCRNGDMIYVGQINKNKTEKLEGLKIKGPFLKMLPQVPVAFSN